MKQEAMTFGRWMTVSLTTWAVGQAVFVALAGVVLNLAIRAWLLPYKLLFCCGFAGMALIYWARQSYHRPKPYALRFALAIFFFWNLYMGALLISTVKVAILSSRDAWTEYAPYIVPGSALGSIIVYVKMRKRFKAATDQTQGPA